MLDVLAYLFQQYYDADGEPDMPQLARRLSGAGFGDDEIREALVWLAELPQVDAFAYAALSIDGPRMLHPTESNKLAEEAIIYWHSLEASRVLSPEERELVLDRVLRDEAGEVEADRLKLIVLMVVWRKRDELSNLLIEEILFGRDGATLH
ncbi:DUF494 family protein [Jeongeupia sp. HS-3]|uniref:DUF494 family protein n=1 Tax=Jeongeupia sp. HS-3 TaxID=1009682 RepID=UPI001910B2FE|nr:DUF494 domain-containing protein [Jeongeupia sp. HS-3]